MVGMVTGFYNNLLRQEAEEHYKQLANSVTYGEYIEADTESELYKKLTGCKSPVLGQSCKSK